MYGTDTYDTGQRHGNEFMVGLLSGMAVGAAIGLLLAPKSGAELRHQLTDSAGRLRERANDTYGRASHAMREVVNRGRGVVEQSMDKGREAVERGRETLKEAMERGREAMDTGEPVDPNRPSFTS